MTEGLDSAVVDGWRLRVEVDRDWDDHTEKIWHTAVHEDGRQVIVDWSPYSGMSNTDFRRWVLLGMPGRDAVPTRGPLSSTMLTALWDRQIDDAPGGWRRRFALWPVRMMDRSMVLLDHYWERRLSHQTQRVRLRSETWDHDDELHPLVQQIMAEPIRRLPSAQGGGKSN